ncbi:acyltransferase [Vibrio sp. D415a]|uniref:acyltransferase n=1 Tax=Vibrio TaxID=662 RepID=UPI00255778CD|nr:MULTISPECIES: acyltransferase [unclassified Vibrio]MDK9728562.1 acyltransferase [Vibrio sp. D415a]MDK9745901.1 acyltransferase [Vibrio sp. D409a]MDK9768654.1 acyltransferase [Vibrio sp. D417a]MDK9785772.1 acyltransferase [Vibrio sp. D421a]
MKLRYKIVALINYISIYYHKLKGALFYTRVFDSFLNGSIIISPIKLSYFGTNIGERVYIAHHSRIEVIKQNHDDFYDPKIIIEDDVRIEQRLHLTCANKVKICKGTSILFDVMITDIDHDYRKVGEYIKDQSFIVNSTTIGEGCFIGSGAKINAGTTLGKQCIVGANSVVRGEFPDYSVIVGAPARIIKRYCFEMNEWRKTDRYGQFIDEN